MKKTPSHRRLALWSALPPYLGGKRRLCPLIFREVDRLLPRRLWSQRTFLDGFLGGGSVSLYAKAQGFRVVATDIALRAIAVGDALIANSRVRLTREEILRLAADPGGPVTPIEAKLAPSVFTKTQARFLDRALSLADRTQDKARAALYRLLAIRVALLAHPMSQIRAGTIHRLETGEYESITESCLGQYVDGLRLTRPDRLWELAQQINAGVFEGEGEVRRESVLDALPSIEADVAYFDPPYPGVMSYEKEYRVIDALLEGSVRETSPFTARDGAAMIDHLFGRAQHIAIWILSLGNAVVGIDELEAKMSRFGRATKAIELAYQHIPAVATEEKKRTNREFLVVGWDEDAVGRLVATELPDRPRGIDLGHDPRSFIEEDPDVLGTEASSPQSLFEERADHRESPFAEQDAVGVGRTVAVNEGHRDDPHAVGTEAGVALQSEGRLG